MVIATFGPSTGWSGRSITYDAGQFVLEGHGPISAANVNNYDELSQLIWAYDGLREWVQASVGAAGPQLQTHEHAQVEPAVRPRGTLVATFNVHTTWVGKEINYVDGVFRLEDQRQISAADVVAYDGQGVLKWTNAKMRAWVWECATPGAGALLDAGHAPVGATRATKSVAAPRERRHRVARFFAWTILSIILLGLAIGLAAWLWPVFLAIGGIYLVYWVIRTLTRR